MLRTVSIQNAPILLRWARSFRLLMFVLPVVVLFYQYKGLTVGDFFLIQGLFSFFAFFLEIPTGYLADVFSRKKVLVMAYIVYFLGYVVWYFFSGFWAILSGELLFGVSIALTSGTTSAYLYDVLKKQGREQDIMKEEGLMNSYATFGTAVAMFFGGYVYNVYGPQAVVIVELLFTFLAFVLILFIPDIPDVRRVVEDGKSKWKDILEISHYAISHPEIKWLMLFPAAFGAATMMMFWSLQPLMQHNMVPVTLFGVFVGINQTLRMFSYHFSHVLFKKLKTEAYSLLIFIFMVIGLTTTIIIPSVHSLHITYALLILVTIAPASQASLSIVSSSMINHRIKSDERATVLSVNAMTKRILNGIIMVLIKFLIDGVGLQNMFAIISPILIILTFVSLKKLLRLKL